MRRCRSSITRSAIYRRLCCSWLSLTSCRSLGKVSQHERAAAPEGTDGLTELVAAPRVEHLLVVGGEVGGREALGQAVTLHSQHQQLAKALPSRRSTIIKGIASLESLTSAVDG